jgi:hypothetical protein
MNSHSDKKVSNNEELEWGDLRVRGVDRLYGVLRKREIALPVEENKKVEHEVGHRESAGRVVEGEHFFAWAYGVLQVLRNNNGVVAKRCSLR